jgi:hypothetical protein
MLGPGKDGQARVQRDSVFRQAKEVFWAEDDEAARLIQTGAAQKPRLSGELAALAEVTLQAESPLEAALAALPLPRIRVWHAVQTGRFWCPSPAALGPGRGGFSARFADPGEARALWAEKPDAVPLFCFATQHGFDRAFIWRQRGLLEIATEIQHLGRS